MITPRLCLSLAVLIGWGGLSAAPSAAGDAAPSVRSSWTISTPRPEPTLKDPLIRRGWEVFAARCGVCHGEYPEEIKSGGMFGFEPKPGTFALRRKYEGELPAVLDRRTDLRPDYIRSIVRGGSGSMPSFRPTEITEDELKALSAYLTRERR